MLGDDDRARKRRQGREESRDCRRAAGRGADDEDAHARPVGSGGRIRSTTTGRLDAARRPPPGVASTRTFSSFEYSGEAVACGFTMKSTAPSSRARRRLRGRAGKNDDRRSRPIRREPAEDREAVEPRHLEIERDEIGLVRHRHSDGLLAVDRRRDDLHLGIGLDHSREGRPGEGTVVGDEDADHFW